ncbi:MAG: hypothetical protein ACKVW3_01525 [Phycisphaerales bacterium]
MGDARELSVSGMPRWAWVAIVLIAWCKLVLVSHDEIRAVPYDSVGFLGMAAARYWGAPYDQWHFARQPGYPLFVALGGSLGLPLRVWIELTWLVAAGIAARGLRVAGIGAAGSVLTFALLAFHPMVTVVFGLVYADTLYACALLVLVVSVGAAVGEREERSRRRWGLMAGFAGIVAANSRQESAIVYGLLMVGLGLAGVEWWRARHQSLSGATLTGGTRDGRRARGRVMLRRVGWAVALPLAMVFVSEHAVRLRTWKHTGAYVTSDLKLPGLRSLYRALVSIPPERGLVKVPIPRDVREKAAGASATFAAMKEVMEAHPALRHYEEAAAHQLKVKGEFGAWSIWALYDAAWFMGEARPTSAAERDERLARATREIRAAMAEGRLARRWVPTAFLPPEWGEIARAIPGSAAACWKKLGRAEYTRTRTVPVPREEESWFDGVANRRSALVALQKGDVPTGFSWLGKRTVARVDGVKVAIGEALPVFTWVAVVVAVVGGVAGLWAMRRGRLGWSWAAMVVLVWAAMVSRFGLVVMLDVAGVDSEMRYLMPVAVLLVVGMMLGLRGLVAWLRPPPVGIGGG